MRQFAIGDIHGCLTALQVLDRELVFGEDDTVVTLGDYVDRGPDSRGVIDFLLGLSKRCQLVSLRGNHEIMMLRARDDRSSLLNWIAVGGDMTLGSYGATGFQDVPDAHWEFLEGTIRYHVAEHDFFVHANVRPDLSLEDQPDFNLFWEHLDGAVSPHVAGRRMICGHTRQTSGLPLDLGNAVCIDTNACGGGWLTCLETGSGIYWQANQQGDLRRGCLKPRTPPE
ncbi:MAG: metallophosphoesterase family protein [Luteolibacter sp.]